MQFGDFSELAKFYVDRPGYSTDVLNCIQAYIMQQCGKNELVIADVGAGTGKLTENLVNLQCPVHGFAVEPMMRCGRKELNYLGIPQKLFGKREARKVQDWKILQWIGY